MANSTAAWRPGNGKRIWFLTREAEDIMDRYRWSKADTLVRYATMQGAQCATDRLNARA